MAASTPRRALNYPPEILLHILSYASDPYSGEHYINPIERNADLARFALVGRAFQQATYSVLYGDLRLAWMGDKVKKLQNSFKNDKRLLLLVRRLDAFAVSEDAWIEYKLQNLDPNDPSRETWFDDYCQRKGIEYDSEEWQELSEQPLELGDAGEEWEEDMRADLEEQWAQRGHGVWKWKGKRNVDGALELLDIVGSAPALRTIVLREFEDALHPSDVAKSGPYPRVESLDALTHSPFFADNTLPSLLASKSPNLRSLCGTMTHFTDQSPKAPPISLPPSLTKLAIIDYIGLDTRIDTLLLQIRPSLRSLTLTTASSGWASSPALKALLSSLEAFVVRDNWFRRHEEDIDSLTRAITPSPSLHHLGIVPASATLIAALPPSLQSIALLPAVNAVEDPRLEMERVLDYLKAASTQPLRVEFLTIFRSEARVAWEACKEEYAAAGYTLSVRRF
ncbi:hypothetical protein RQP46_004138 [Phenoliferia psychrophenolica]